MTQAISTQNLPYNLPTSRQEQLYFLADLLNIQRELVVSGGQTEIDAFCATILYRHLSPVQRREAMGIIRQTPKKLQGRLVERVLGTTFVNAQWGIWSLTHEELKQDQNFHNTLDTYASYIGISASALGTKDVITDIWQNKKLSRGGIALLVIWGAVAFNKAELNKANAEVQRRSQLNSTGFH